MMNNQYILGSTGAADAERRQLLLPWIVHPEARTVCCLGLATGISASALETLEDPPQITAVELSANVVRISRQHFDKETQGFFERAENRVVVEDARTYVAAAHAQFDLIVADLFRPHGVGEGRLFSLEHYQNVRRALTENGLFCQWLPIYQLNYENLEVIAATFQRVFPETLVIYGNIDASNPVFGLMARKDDRPWQGRQLTECFDRIPPSLVDQDPILSSPGLLVAGVLRNDATGQVPLNTLDNLRIEIDAGNFWILKDLRNDRSRMDFESEFIAGVHLVEFNRRLRQMTTPVLPREQFREFDRRIREQLEVK